METLRLQLSIIKTKFCYITSEIYDIFYLKYLVVTDYNYKVKYVLILFIFFVTGRLRRRQRLDIIFMRVKYEIVLIYIPYMTHGIKKNNV